MTDRREAVANAIWDDRVIRGEIYGTSWTKAKSLPQSGWKGLVESVYSDADAAIAAYEASQRTEPTDAEIEATAKDIYDTFIKGKPYLPGVPFDQITPDSGLGRHLRESACRLLGRKAVTP